MFCESTETTQGDTATIGFGWVKEPLTTLKIVSMVLIVAGVRGLNATMRAG